MTAFDKSDVNSAEAGLKYFLFGSTASAFTLFGLSFVYGMTGTTGLAAIAQKINGRPISVAPLCRNRHDPDRIRVQNCRRAIPSLGAGRLPRRACSDRRIHRVRLESGVVPRARETSARRFRSRARERCMARDDCRLGARAGGAGGLRSYREISSRSRNPMSAACSPTPPSPMPATLCSASSPADAKDLARHYSTLTVYAFTLVGASAVVALSAPRNRRRRLARIHRTLACARRCSPGAWRSLCFPCRPSAVRRIFRKVLPLKRRIRAGENHGLLWLVVIALFGSFISLYYYLIVLKKIFVDQPTVSTISPSTRSFSLGFPQAFAVSVLAAIVVLLGVNPEFLVARILLRFEMKRFHDLTLDACLKRIEAVERAAYYYRSFLRRC